MADPVTTDALKQVALEPQEVRGDQGTTINPSLRDLIAADKYLRGTVSTNKSNRLSMIRGMFMKINAPSARG